MRIKIALAVLLLIGTGCAQLAQLPPIKLGSNANPPVLGDRPIINERPVLRLRKIWDHRLAPRSSIYTNKIQIQDKQIYQLSHSGHLIALNQSTGKMLWRIKTPYALSSNIGCNQQSLFIGTKSGQLVAYDKNNGRHQWTTALSTEIIAAPQADDHYVIAHTMDGKITALDPKTGEIVWCQDSVQPQFSLRANSQPILTDDCVIVGFSNGKLVGMDKASGAIQWENNMALSQTRGAHRMMDIASNPLLDDTGVIASAFESKTARIDRNSGETVWERDVLTLDNACLDEKAVYINDLKGILWALDKMTGEVLWKQDQLQKRAIHGPIVVKDLIAVVDQEGYVYFINKETGKINAEHSVDAARIADMLYNDGLLFVLTHNGRLITYRISLN